MTKTELEVELKKLRTQSLKRVTVLAKMKEEVDAEFAASKSPLAIERANGKKVTLDTVLKLFKSEMKTFSVAKTSKKK